MKLIYKIIFVLAFVVPFGSSAQEYLSPMSGNINLFYNNPVNAPLKNLQTEKLAQPNDTIPFFEDFFYAPNSPYPTGKHWVDSTVFINTGFGIAPPSIGVATFDGLNKKGYPYNIAATVNSSSPADTLTSRPINLMRNSKKTYTYSPVDSVGISFLYQSVGFGENPTQNDSLVLDFFKPKQKIWVRAWSKRGNAAPPLNDTIFKKAFVRIKDTAYFHEGFRFRFRNRATGAGSADHWHVDYISLKTNLYKTDTSYNEVTFGYMPRPILKNYSAMPFNQYQASEMATNFSNFIRNNNVGVVKQLNYDYTVYNASMTFVAAYGNTLSPVTNTANIGNCNPFCTRGWDSVSTHKNPPINYTISPMTDSTFFIIKHVVSTNPDIWKFNDTIIQKLAFNNFYAYDDGSAESVYSHNTFGAKDAIKYSLNVTDTLRALDIFFDPFLDGNIIKNSQFRMYVWADGGSSPGSVIRKDSTQKPIYLDHGYNKIPRYFFTSPMILGPGTYYFGMQQITSQTLCVGFDRNLDRRTKHYYDVGSGWIQSAIKGSIMIHPVFGEATRALVGIAEQGQTKRKEGFINVYPNPASDKLFISASEINPSDNYSIELYSLLGTKLTEVTVENSVTEINLNDYASGIYFVMLKQGNTTLANKKFIISR